MEQSLKIKTQSFAELIDEINILDSKQILDWSYLCKYINPDVNLELFTSIYKRKIDWLALSENDQANFTEAFILKNKDSIQWNGTKIGNYKKYGGYNLGGFSYNRKCPINVNFLEKVEDYIDWRSLGMNPSLKIVDPFDVPDIEFFDEEVLKNQAPIFDVIITYWDNWCKDGSFWVADLYSGHTKDSIFDNPNIDWAYFEENKSDYKNWEDKLQKFFTEGTDGTDKGKIDEIDNDLPF